MVLQGLGLSQIPEARSVMPSCLATTYDDDKGFEAIARFAIRIYKHFPQPGAS
jgi:hypothetical protein